MISPDEMMEAVLEETQGCLRKMKTAKSIDEKLKYSQHILNLSTVLENFISMTQLAMNMDDIGDFEEEGLFDDDEDDDWEED